MDSLRGAGQLQYLRSGRRLRPSAQRSIPGVPHRLARVRDRGSHRFERGVDWQLQREAMERATALILEIVGGEISSIYIIVNPEKLQRVPPLRPSPEGLRAAAGGPSQD